MKLNDLHSKDVEIAPDTVVLEGAKERRPLVDVYLSDGTVYEIVAGRAYVPLFGVYAECQKNPLHHPSQGRGEQ
jgi:hypothetical protein